MNPNLITLNDNVLAAMDVETTGREPGVNEVCQLAVVTLDCHLEPIQHFYTNIRPSKPQNIHADAVATHGLTLEVLMEAPDKYKVTEMFWEWFQKLNLVPGKRLVPLVHNAQFDIPFVQDLFGLEFFYDVFGYPTRDTQAVICGMMDKAAYNGTKCPFNRASLGNACEALGVQLDDAHDALADALATARVYQRLLSLPSW